MFQSSCCKLSFVAATDSSYSCFYNVFHFPPENGSRKLRCGPHCFISVPFCGIFIVTRVCRHKAQSKHEDSLNIQSQDKMTQLEVCLLLCSNACSTSALTSHLRFPSTLTPLGIKLLTNHRSAPPMPPRLLPSHLPVHTKTASPSQTKIRTQPHLQRPSHQVSP